MGKAKQISSRKRTDIVELKKADLTNKGISEQLNVTQPEVLQLLHKVDETGCREHGQRIGRPHLVSEHAER